MNAAEMLLQLGSWLIQQPAVQGVLVAGATQAIKRTSVGRAGGPRTRLVAAALALASVIASAASTDSLQGLDAQVLGEHVLEVVAAFLSAVGAWQVTSKKNP